MRNRYPRKTDWASIREAVAIVGSAALLVVVCWLVAAILYAL